MLMKDVKNVHLLFEQSGHFKNVFKSLGFNAYDYDIENQFNETDFIIDLFQDIEDYSSQIGRRCIFDDFNKNDLVIAFFPCVCFSELNILSLKCLRYDIIKKSNVDKCYLTIKYMNKLNYFYRVFCELLIIAYEKGFKLIVENPFQEHHFLRRYLPILPTVIDYNRLAHGDNFVKPTQYWFINFEPIIQFEHYLPKRSVKKTVHETNKKIDRSLINEEYIKWFIQEYIFEDVRF